MGKHINCFGFFPRSTSTTASLSLTTAAASAPSTSPSSAWSSPAPASQGARRGSHPASSAAAPTGWRGRTAIDARSDTGPTPASGAGVRRQNTFPAKKRKENTKTCFFVISRVQLPPVGRRVHHLPPADRPLQVQAWPRGGAVPGLPRWHAGGRHPVSRR